MVTADLPAFVRPGDRIDVTVSSFGDARSLQGSSCCRRPWRRPTGVYMPLRKALCPSEVSTSGGGAAIKYKAIIPSWGKYPAAGSSNEQCQRRSWTTTH